MENESPETIETVLGPAALEGIPEGGVWRVSLASVRPEEGVEEIVLSLETEDGAPHAPPRVALALHAPIGAAVAKGAYGELICDGLHVAPAMVLLAWKAFGTDRLALVSDNIRPAGAPDGTYDSGGLEVFLKNGEARLADGTLAGCSITLWECVRRAVSFGIPFADAIRMATATPAAAARLDAGYIAPGGPADILLVDDSGSLPELRGVILRGERFA